MRFRSKGFTRGAIRMLILAAPFLLIARLAVSSSLNRLSAEFQNSDEIFTNATPAPTPFPPGAPGGMVVYDKTLNIPPGVVYLTFSAQGDTHELTSGNTPIPGTSAALLMTASLTDATGNVTICQPMKGATGSAAIQAPWMTLIKLPDGETSPNNCGDGAGGPADCHDNAFLFSCCAIIKGPAGTTGKGGESSGGSSSGSPYDVKINMASTNGGFVFYEDSTIYIDQGANGDGSFCTGVGTTHHSAPTATSTPHSEGD